MGTIQFPQNRLAPQRPHRRPRQLPHDLLPVARLFPRPVVQRAVPPALPQLDRNVLDQRVMIVRGAEAAAVASGYIPPDLGVIGRDKRDPSRTGGGLKSVIANSR